MVFLPPHHRVPIPQPPAEVDAEDRVALRLAIGRAGLEIELAQPAVRECISVDEIGISLRVTRFPIDVSGGVARFRHRRGLLERIGIHLDASALIAWAAPKLKGLLGVQSPELSLDVRAEGVSCAIVSSDPPANQDATSPILAFDVLVHSENDDIFFAVTGARGADLATPPTAVALLAMSAVLGPLAERHGATFIVRRAAEGLVRHILPDAGARAPECTNIAWTEPTVENGTWLLHAARGLPSIEPSEPFVRALHLNELTRDGDEFRFQRRWANARSSDLAALDRAPKHAEIGRRLIELDAHAGGRVEAALATVAMLHDASTLLFGTLVGALREQTGDLREAIAELVREGEREPTAALSARAFERAAALTSDPFEALTWLDRAVARAPSNKRVRWRRLERRLAEGHLREAVADAESLEAQTEGAVGKHAVWQRTGDLWRQTWPEAKASVFYERALRYVPDECWALTGLGVALIDEGHVGRGITLVSRAVHLAELERRPTGSLSVRIARALAEKLNDAPAAIARVRSIADDDPVAMQARGYEGRWRASIGDHEGASLAFARMRGLIRPPSDDATAVSMKNESARWLLEAATFETDQRADPNAAYRHLTLAIRRAPADPAIATAYRNACAAIAPLRPSGPERAPNAAQLSPPVEQRASVASGTSHSLTDIPSLEARVEELIRRMQLEPSNDAVVDALSEGLTALGRGHELLALLSARLEDATEDRRRTLLPKTLAALERLAHESETRSAPDEAALYRRMATIFSRPKP